MLCEVCHLIFEGGPQARVYRLDSVGVEYGRTIRYIHHATTRSLVNAAALYCYICFRVWRDAISHGFSRGPELRWQRDCSTSYVLQTFDRQTLSVSSLELLVSYARKRRDYDEPGPDKIVFWTKFILEPAKLDGLSDDTEKAEKEPNILESTGSEKALDLALKWILDCRQNHTECIQPGSLGKQLPTRLIKVGDAQSSTISLYEGNDPLYETNEGYVTLSHCWGTAQIFTLNKFTHEKLRAGIKDSELPRTFQAAIKFTRRLGVKYIWIDSLCILQGQDSLDDWLRESSAMTRTYQQALCNISALASSTSNGGCFRERDPRSIKPCKIDARWAGLPKGTFNIYHEMLWQSDVTAAPLHKRAWVVQERLLAPRVVHCGREQLFWECHTMNACETYPDGLPPCLALSDPSINFKGLSPSLAGEKLRMMSNWDCSDSSLNQLYVWEKVVRTYTSCALTKEQDKLIAISGIAKRVQPLSPSDLTDNKVNLSSYRPAQYLAGLWDFFLPAQLLWEVRKGCRPKAYRAPSWSWASADGEVSFHGAFNDGIDLIKILKAITHPISEDPFGQVSYGSIQLEGYPRPVYAARKIGDNYILTTINGHEISTVCRPDTTDDPSDPERHLYCLPIRDYRVTTETVITKRLGCLILAPTRTNGEGIRGEFHRWAQITLDNEIDQDELRKAKFTWELDFTEFVDKDITAGKFPMTII